MNTDLVQLRKDAKLSRAHAARRLGLDESTLYLWEAGRRSPNGKNLLALAELYQVRPAVILAAIERQRSAGAVSSGDEHTTESARSE